MDETLRGFSFACKPGCNFCCTTKLFVTSVEAELLLDSLDEKDWIKIYALPPYPRPKYTHNQLALLYFTGDEPKEENPEGEITSCPFLTSKGLCKVYDHRPLICRLLLSFITCSPSKPAEISEKLYLLSLISLQVAENLDFGGLYGNLFDLLKYLRDYKTGIIEEIPSHLLSTVEFEELPLLPDERELRGWVGGLYRRELPNGMTFRELLNTIKEDLKTQSGLSFLREIWSE